MENKYYNISWYEGTKVFHVYPTNSLNGYKKDKIVISYSNRIWMTTSDLEKGIESFKKQYLKHIKKLENDFMSAKIEIKKQ